MTSILANIEATLESAWNAIEGKVEGEVKAAENAAVVFYKDLIAATAAHGTQYVTVLSDAATAAVATAAALPGDGAAKALAAAASVAATLTKEGLPIIDNDVKGAIEAAYASFKAAQTPATPVAASIGTATASTTAPSPVTVGTPAPSTVA